jgi:hypothetical protein
MSELPREQALAEITALLGTSPNDEQAFQTFFEQRPFALPLPFLLGHHVQFESVITKLPIDTSLVCDFCYITRHSARTQIVLIELEAPGKKIFTSDHKYLKETSELSSAKAQIATWKDFLSGNKDSLIQRLIPLLKPKPMILSGPIDIRYVLIYGRRTEFDTDDRRTRRYRSFTEGDTYFLTYDSVLTNLREIKNLFNLNVLRLAAQRYTFKYMHDLPTSMFGWLGPGEFFLSQKHRAKLVENHFEMDAWDSGKFLSVDGMFTSFEARMKHGSGGYAQSLLYIGDTKHDPAAAYEM